MFGDGLVALSIDVSLPDRLSLVTFVRPKYPRGIHLDLETTPIIHPTNLQRRYLLRDQVSGSCQVRDLKEVTK